MKHQINLVKITIQCISAVIHTSGITLTVSHPFFDYES